MNILTFTKTVNNWQKLVRDLKANTVFGPVYNFFSLKGDQLEIHFTQNLNQTQIDALAAFIASYSDVSVFDTLYNYLGKNIDPFVDELLREVRAKNMELGITQTGKTYEVLGFFQQYVTVPGRTRSVSLLGSLSTSSLTVTIELLMYFEANPSLYDDINPYITAERLAEMREKITSYLAAP